MDDLDACRRLAELLANARATHAARESDDRSGAGLVERIGATRYAWATLTGFLDAFLVTDRVAAANAAPRVEAFIGEAVAASLMLG